MRYGVCTGPDNIAMARECGYDFVEYQLRELDHMSDKDIADIAAGCRAQGIWFEAMNCMLPAECRLTGPDVDLAPIKAYLEKNVPRAAAIGCKTIVFGSSGSRDMPAGFSDKKMAMEQLAEYLRMASQLCGAHDIAIAIEPLGGTNIITYLAEGHHLIKLTDRENVRLLADLYAMSCVYEPCGAIVPYGEDFEHLHFAAPLTRKFPREGDGCDYAPFFDAVRAIGFDKRISIEAGLNGDMREDYLGTLALMKKYLQ